MKMTFFLIFVLTFLVVTNSFGQKPSIELSFIATYQTQYVTLDSIYVENLTQGGDTILYAPDTTLVLEYVTGVAANLYSNTGFRVSQNRPNPFAEQTSISIFLPEADHLQLSVVNLVGQKVAFIERSLKAGSHSFVFYPGNDQYYILMAACNGVTNAIKMLSQNNHSSERASLIYQGSDETQAEYKSSQDINDFVYSFGDQLRFIGFAKNPSEIAGSDIIEATPAGNENYVFEIIEGIPCPGTPNVTYEGQTYNTVQIGEQCWFKENLNIGTMIPGEAEMTNNGTIEKYCYENNSYYCPFFGGLYQWNEMMDYSTAPGVQGICPAGWHIATDAEWTALIYFLGGEAVAGGKMKTPGTAEAGTSWWQSPNTGATNSSGFSATTGGACVDYGWFGGLYGGAWFWSSTEDVTSEAWRIALGYNTAEVEHVTNFKIYGFSIRCVHD